METLMQSGPCSTSRCRITVIWITLVSRHLLKWSELHPWKVSHPCTKQEIVWNAPTQSCHRTHSYELDKCQVLVLFFKGQEQVMQADFTVVWFLLIVEEPVKIGCQLYWSSILGRRMVSRGASPLGSSLGMCSRPFGACSGTSPWTTGSKLPPPAWSSEHCWLCYANEERWISHFPQPGFAQLCIYYPPLKIQRPQRRGMAHFYLFASRVGTDLSSNHPGLWSAKLPFVVQLPHPPDCLQDTQRHLHASKQVISWFGKTCQGDENVAAFADKPSDKPGVTSPAPCPHSHLRMVSI